MLIISYYSSVFYTYFQFSLSHVLFNDNDNDNDNGNGK